MIDLMRRGLTRLGVLAGHPLAFLIGFAYVAAWLVFEPETFDRHGDATIVVWIMTLFIQRAETRDTQSNPGQARRAASCAQHGQQCHDAHRRGGAEDIERHREDARKDD